MLLSSENIPEVEGAPPHLLESRRLAIALILPALFLIFLLDRATGTAPVQHLYYLPIIYASMAFDAPGGLVAASVAIVLYHLANHPRSGTPYGELDVIQISLFLAVAIVAARLTSNARHLRTLATRDDLTGLHNLRSFEEHLSAMVAFARDANEPLAMLALDVDNLTRINEAYGHLAGAGAVRTVGEIIALHLPVSAVACRYGGDEFVIAIPCCTVAEARRIGNELCTAVYAARPVLCGLRMPAKTLSISVGVAGCFRSASDSMAANVGIADFFAGDQFPGFSSRGSDDAAAEMLFRAADEALYYAKASGRNRVCAGRSSAPKQLHHPG
jgi:diguanylate cyclase (GGDEF)-like protein